MGGNTREGVKYGGRDDERKRDIGSKGEKEGKGWSERK